ncbi:TOMM precursor leader peptide-binding protein [Solwaraspora sp. WMMD1047]|uniref:TOMM precursor leader peptide-binding protein n=1 Tax=Solwaraspora sp. WMMD1047 TaxID=3016102 RepID=UPI00241596D6|nr:TOMM precursor leader peptide-binding protein [Solwaraspora sp. WMMD1047]MDG4832111.1 TOMM precursor leader peptide-binding protein [Solwaraspora sp. WMMD1047]
MTASPAQRRVPVDRVARYLTERADRLPYRVAVDVDVLGLADRLTGPPPDASVDATGPDALAAGPVPAVLLPVRLYGRTALIGPVGSAGPAAPPCVRCLERRWQETRPMPERRALEIAGAHPEGGPDGIGAAPLPTMLGRLWSVARHLLAEPPAEPGTAGIYEVALDTAVVRRHLLIADSLCPRCAVPAVDTRAAADRPLVPRPKPAPDRYRLRDTGSYRLDGFVDPVCGPLGGTALRIYQFGATAPVSGLFRVRSKYDLHDSWWSGHAYSYAESERAGILEGLERYAGQQPRSRPVVVRDSLANLGADALDPRDCGGYRPGFYSGRHHYQPFTPELPMRWVWGRSLRDERPVLVPEQLVYYLDRHVGENNFVQECSNGCASGSCPEEAAFYGLLELIERDAFLLSWYARRTVPEIDIRTVASPEVQFMRERIGLFGYHVRLFDLRADLPVPVVMAVAVRRDGGLGTLCFAAGSSLDPTDAVRAALCETASYVPGFADRVAASLAEVRPMATDYERLTELRHHALLYGLPEMAPHADFFFDDPPLVPMAELYRDWLAERPVTEDLTDDLRHLVDRVAGLGSDVLVVDQTCPEQRRSGVHTSAVVAPGLLPIDFGWARQRVLHHPRFTGWLRRTGAAAHPHPHPFP